MKAYFVSGDDITQGDGFLCKTWEEAEKLSQILQAANRFADPKIRIYDTEDEFKKYILAGGRNFHVCIENDPFSISIDEDAFGEREPDYCGGTLTLTVRAGSKEEAAERAKEIYGIVSKEYEDRKHHTGG